MKTLSHAATRGLMYVLCAFLLLAQQAALTHAASHLRGTVPGHEREITKQDRDQGPASDISRLCAFDAAFGQVLGGGPGTHHAAFSTVAVTQTAAHRSRVCIAADALTPRSRGPPVLL